MFNVARWVHAFDMAQYLCSTWQGARIRRGRVRAFDMAQYSHSTWQGAHVRRGGVRAFDVAGCLLWVGRWVAGGAERDTSHLVGLPMLGSPLGFSDSSPAAYDLPCQPTLLERRWSPCDVASPNKPCGTK